MKIKDFYPHLLAGAIVFSIFLHSIDGAPYWLIVSGSILIGVLVSTVL